MLCLLFYLFPFGIAFYIFYRLLLIQDCDLTILFWTKFGRKPSYLRNKVIWITGASSGIGEGVAYQLAAVNAKLILSGRNLDNLKKVREKCLELNPALTGDDVLILQFDIMDYDKHEEMIERAIEHFKQIDILFNNAGRNIIASFEEIEIKVDKELFETNVFGPLNFTRILLRHWLKTKFPGHLVIHSSIAGIASYPYSSSYNASKFALHGYYEALRCEAFRFGIRVTLICPGAVHSNVVANSYTAKYGEKFNEDFNEEKMSTQRAAYLIIVAMANQCEEVWFSLQPCLAVCYLITYFRTMFRYFIVRWLPDSYHEGLKIGKE